MMETTIKILKKKIQKLIVDNYKIDSKWEKKVKDIQKLIVIDDLANRNHLCDIIIDQNYVKNYKTRYDKIINKNCLKLLGPKFCINSDIKKRIKFQNQNTKIKRIFYFFLVLCLFPNYLKNNIFIFKQKVQKILE